MKTTRHRQIGWGVFFLGFLIAAAPAQGQEQRFLVRFDHGTANLSSWAGLRLYIGAGRVKVFSGETLVHDISAASMTGITHELRAPFDPAKTTERVFNDTVGSCMDLTCVPVAAAGLVGAAGVGIATLFTPKEYVINLHWAEGGQPKELGIKVAWYQKEFILGALRNATGLRATERAALATQQLAPTAPMKDTPQPGQAEAPAPVPAPVAPVSQTETSPTQAQPVVHRIEWVVDRPVRVGDKQLEPGFYLVLLQEKPNHKAVLLFLDDSLKDAEATKIVAGVTADVLEDVESLATQMVLRNSSEGTYLAQVRLRGKVLNVIN